MMIAIIFKSKNKVFINTKKIIIVIIIIIKLAIVKQT